DLTVTGVQTCALPISDKPVRAVVPLLLTGKAAGVKEGGTLHQVYRTLIVSCVPGKIPTNIELDVSALGIGQAVHVTDMKLPEGVDRKSVVEGKGGECG